jgi:hypothetical protein
MQRQLQLHLEPSNRNEVTWLCLAGELSTWPRPEVPAVLLKCLARLSDRPIEFVLPVACPDGPWFDTWPDGLDAIPVHLEIRFALEPGLRTRVEP